MARWFGLCSALLITVILANAGIHFPVWGTGGSWYGLVAPDTPAELSSVLPSAHALTAFDFDYANISRYHVTQSSQSPPVMHTTPDLFGSAPVTREPIADGAWLLRGFVSDQADQLLEAIRQVTSQAPFRHQVTPGGHSMSAAMSSCGPLGWVTDRFGYRYSATDPLTNQPWPAMPRVLKQIAVEAATAAGYEDFQPDACLINRYETGAKMGLHQDKDEEDMDAPIVSVSLGAPIRFLFGGAARTDKAAGWKLEHGDVVVWGGPSRLFFHGVAPLGKRAEHPLTGPVRYNLTFRTVRLLGPSNSQNGFPRARE